MRKQIALAIALAAGLAVPAFAQTTTTVQTQPQAAPPPPPPSSTTTTTVQTQPAQPATPSSTTQVVVNPNDPPPPNTTTHTRARVAAEPDVVTIETRNQTPPLQIVAVDALYGGLIGTVIGGGITLIEQGNNWQRNLAVGAGVGILAGVAFGAYDASTRYNSVVTRADADPVPGTSNGARQFAALGGKF